MLVVAANADAFLAVVFIHLNAGKVAFAVLVGHNLHPWTDPSPIKRLKVNELDGGLSSTGVGGITALFGALPKG